MRAVARNPKFAKKVGIPVSVGEDFSAADKGRKFSKGGVMAKKMFGGKESFAEEVAEAKAVKSGKVTPNQYAKKERAEPTVKMAKGGGVESRGKTRGKFISM